MRTDYFRERIQKSGMLMGTQCFTGNPAIVEILGHAGWEWVSLDMEHAPTDFAQIEHLVRAAQCSNIVPLVRVGKNDPLLISKVLDTGAAGVIVPHISSVENLEEAVASTMYPPHGNRGACGTTRATGYGYHPWKEYIQEADKGVVVVPLIEDQAGIDAFDQLLKVENVPVYWIGIADLTVSMGLTGADFWHPKLDALGKSLNQRAKAAGKELMIAAAPHLRPDYIQHLSSLGFRLISIGTDLSFYRQSLEALTKQLRPA